MKIAFFSHMDESGISGGRYLAWTMAEALARVGHTVDFYSDNEPPFIEDFSDFSKVKIHISRDYFFSNMSTEIDWCIFVPDLFSNSLYNMFHKLLDSIPLKVALLNFETPNWFNLMAPQKRKISSWDKWVSVAKRSDLILSISGEGDRYARLFYKNLPKSTKFRFCYPGINTITADKVPKQTRNKQIICITRVDAHKGIDLIPKLFSRELKGYRFVIFLGSGRLNSNIMKRLERKATKNGIELDIKYAVMAHPKFTEIKKSKLMVFPSFFEGFGIPPLESLYCGTPCAVFDLPVLRECTSAALDYAPIGNWKALGLILAKILNGEIPQRIDAHRDRIDNIARLENYGARLTRIFENMG